MIFCCHTATTGQNWYQVSDCLWSQGPAWDLQAAPWCAQYTSYSFPGFLFPVSKQKEQVFPTKHFCPEVVRSLNMSLHPHIITEKHFMALGPDNDPCRSHWRGLSKVDESPTTTKYFLPLPSKPGRAWATVGHQTFANQIPPKTNFTNAVKR